MLDRLQASFERQKSFIANASPDLRNPLPTISGELEVTLLKERTPAEYVRSLGILQKETGRLEKLTSYLLGLANTGFDAEEMPREAVKREAPPSSIRPPLACSETAPKFLNILSFGGKETLSSGA